ncbi:MAG: metallophosphoesterase family protein [Alphaproteobacteria bacterium]
MRFSPDFGPFTFAHFADLHLGQPPRPRLGELLNKRLLGYLSWIGRHGEPDGDHALDPLAHDLRRLGVEHVVVTGDLVNISLPSEFQHAARWLRSLGPPDWITVVPGNHDSYVWLPWSASLGCWADYMSHDDTGTIRRAPPGGANDFPIVRIRGSIAFLGLTSARPTSLFRATGALGDWQLARLDDYLRALGRQGLFRVVLLHHEPLRRRAKGRRKLVDGRALVETIADAGAELVLHGHLHKPCIGKIGSAFGTVPVVGVSSLSGRPRRAVNRWQYHVYRIARNMGRWRLTMSVRQFDEGLQAFTEKAEVTLAVGAEA